MKKVLSYCFQGSLLINDIPNTICNNKNYIYFLTQQILKIKKNIDTINLTNFKYVVDPTLSQNEDDWNKQDIYVISAIEIQLTYSDIISLLRAYNSKELLINLRKIVNLTQKELADKSGVSINTIAKIEQGQRNGTKETWDQLLQVINSTDTENNSLEIPHYLKISRYEELLERKQTILKFKEEYKDLNSERLNDLIKYFEDIIDYEIDQRKK